MVFKVQVCPNQTAWSGTLLSTGEWTDISKYLKSDLSSVLDAVGVSIKISSHTWLGQVMSTLQMFTVLRVCKVLFIRHRWPALMYSQLWSSHFFFALIYFLFSCLWFFVCSKLPILYCDSTWLYRRYEWVTRNLIHFSWTWHTNMNMNLEKEEKKKEEKTAYKKLQQY